MCFKTLASQCMNALKKGNFDTEEMEIYKEKLNEMSSESSSILPCIRFIQNQLEKAK